jgi:hypothetical protein
VGREVRLERKHRSRAVLAGLGRAPTSTRDARGRRRVQAEAISYRDLMGPHARKGLRPGTARRQQLTPPRTLRKARSFSGSAQRSNGSDPESVGLPLPHGSIAGDAIRRSNSTGQRWVAFY